VQLLEADRGKGDVNKPAIDEDVRRWFDGIFERLLAHSSRIAELILLRVLRFDLL
jgi:hypothetical protein